MLCTFFRFTDTYSLNESFYTQIAGGPAKPFTSTSIRLDFVAALQPEKSQINRRINRAYLICGDRIRKRAIVMMTGHLSTFYLTYED
jgi:hypothetical protein